MINGIIKYIEHCSKFDGYDDAWFERNPIEDLEVKEGNYYVIISKEIENYRGTSNYSFSLLVSCGTSEHNSDSMSFLDDLDDNEKFKTKQFSPDGDNGHLSLSKESVLEFVKDAK